MRARPSLTFALSRWRLCSANAGGVLKAVTSQIRDEWHKSLWNDRRFFGAIFQWFNQVLSIFKQDWIPYNLRGYIPWSTSSLTDRLINSFLFSAKKRTTKNNHSSKILWTELWQRHFGDRFETVFLLAGTDCLHSLFLSMLCCSDISSRVDWGLVGGTCSVSPSPFPSVPVAAAFSFSALSASIRQSLQ